MIHFRILLVLAALCASQARADTDTELPTYPGTVHTRIGNDLIINGAYYRLAYFKTKDSMRTVAEHFFHNWKEEGYPTVIEGDGKEEVVVTAFYTREGLARSVILRRHGDITLGFSVLKDLWVEPRTRETPPPVQLEGELFASDMRSRNEGGNNAAYTGIIEGALNDVRQDVISQMARKGFSMVRAYGEKRDGVMQQMLEFSSKQKQVLISVTQVDDHLVAVSQSELGAFGNQNTQLQHEKKQQPPAKAPATGGKQ